MESKLDNIPNHIGVILDGNRRFSKKSSINPLKGHDVGYENVKNLMKWCKEFGVKQLTLFAFSLENFKRKKEEVDYLMGLFVKAFNSLAEENVNELKINFIGCLEMFPENVRTAMDKLMAQTKNNIPFVVNFAMGYGGRAEIIGATKAISKDFKEGKIKADDITEESFKRYLYIESEPDLIIRTSESRLSGFLTYQGVYAELIFLPDKLWPEFSKGDFISCLEEYSNRKRRFGK